jgi:myosin heavy subunit
MELKSNATVKIIIVAAFIVMLSVIGWLLVERFKIKQENEDLIENTDQLENEIQQLETDLVTMQTEISNKDLQLEEKDKLIEEKDKELAKKRRQIENMLSQGKINQQKANEYLAKIQSMEQTIQKYESEIASLKGQITEISTEKEMIEKEKEMVENQNQQLSQEKDALQGKVNVAAILKAANFRFSNIKSGGKESDAEEEFKAGRLNILKIQYTLLDNAVAATGPKDVYIQIIHADGSIGKNLNSASGTFSYEGSDVMYTLKQSVNYERISSRQTLNYQPQSKKFDKGNLKVKVYCDGYMIGQGELYIK